MSSVAIPRTPLPTPPRDALARALHDLRISVIDRCNFRCPYCMPEDQYAHDHVFLKKDERLRFEEIARIARAFVELGVRKLRLTGGEPLLRRDLPELVRQLAQIPQLEDLALTTNGVLLPRLAQALKNAGLMRLTVSLDTLDATTYRHLSGGRGEVAEVLAGISGCGRGRIHADQAELCGDARRQRRTGSGFARTLSRQRSYRAFHRIHGCRHDQWLAARSGGAEPATAGAHRHSLATDTTTTQLSRRSGAALSPTPMAPAKSASLVLSRNRSAGIAHARGCLPMANCILACLRTPDSICVARCAQTPTMPN